MIKLFSRKNRPLPIGEKAPQLTRIQRAALLTPSAPTGGLPYRVYDEMMGDSMVQTVVTIKRLGVLAGGWKLVAESDPEAQKRKAFVEQAFQMMEGSPNTILAQAMDSFVKGWSIQEMVYRAEGGKVWLAACRPKDPSYFGLEVDAFGRVEGLVLRVPGERPLVLDRRKFVVYANRASYADPKGRSDLDAAYRHWQAKQDLLAAWKLHLARFAMPTVLGRFVRGLPEADQTAIFNSLQNLQDNSAILFPDEIEISTLGGQKEGSQGFETAIDFHNREIARAVLGQTLTTDEGRRVGSLALGKVHLQVLMLQLASLRDELADVVLTEQVVRPLVEANFGPGPVPRFAFDRTTTEVFATGKVN